MTDWESLLQGRADGLTWVFGGVRVGDDISALRFDRLTNIMPRIWPRTANIRRSWSSQGIFDISEDGSESPVSKEQLLSELFKHGGSALVDQVGCEISDKKIRKIWIRGAPLSGLPFKREKDIQRVLGPALGPERAFGIVAYHYPQRHLTVRWDTKEDRIESVSIGPVDWVPPVFSAKNVLDEYIQGAIAGLGPEWAEPAEENSSNWVRYKRVQALLGAFGLGDPVSFTEGRFLEGKALDSFPLCHKSIQECCRSGFFHPFPDDALTWLFCWLLNYRTKAEELPQINSGLLMADHPAVLTAIQLEGDVNKKLAAALSDIEDLLFEMISPDGRQFSEEEMINQWGWPQVDLNFLIQSELWGEW